MRLSSWWNLPITYIFAAGLFFFSVIVLPVRDDLPGYLALSQFLLMSLEQMIHAHHCVCLLCLVEISRLVSLEMSQTLRMHQDSRALFDHLPPLQILTKQHFTWWYSRNTSSQPTSRDGNSCMFLLSCFAFARTFETRLGNGFTSSMARSTGCT